MEPGKLAVWKRLIESYFDRIERAGWGMSVERFEPWRERLAVCKDAVLRLDPSDAEHLDEFVEATREFRRLEREGTGEERFAVMTIEDAQTFSAAYRQRLQAEVSQSDFETWRAGLWRELAKYAIAIESLDAGAVKTSADALADLRDAAEGPEWVAEVVVARALRDRAVAEAQHALREVTRTLQYLAAVTALIDRGQHDGG